MDIAFSPDGNWLATVDFKGSIKIWEVATGQEVRTLSGHEERISCVAFSPDGSLIASGSIDKSVKLWDFGTGQLKYTLLGHSDWINAVAFSPDSHTVASGSSDGTVRLWDVESGKEIRKLVHYDRVSSLTFNPVGDQLASGSQGEIVIWKASTGETLTEITGLIFQINGVAYSPDGTKLAGALHDGSVIIFELANMGKIHTLNLRAGSAMDVTFSTDGHLLATAGCKGKNAVSLWNTDKWQKRRLLSNEKGPIWSVAFSPDSKILASGSNSNTVKFWDVSTGQEIRILTDR